MPQHSPEVYRRRRIAAVIALLLAVGIIWALVAGVSALVKAASQQDAEPPAQNQSAAPATRSTPTPSGSPRASGQSSNPSASSTPSPTEMPLCYPEALSVEVSTDRTDYKKDQKPVLVLNVKNVSKEGCVANVGTKDIVFVIQKGNNRIFSSKDCQINAESLLKNIPAGKSETSRFTWNRNKSTPGCKAVTGKLEPGTYQLTASLGNLLTQPASFEIMPE